MAVSYKTIWKNILDKLVSVMKADFKNSCQVVVGDEQTHSSNYVRLIPVSDELISYTVSSEEREYQIKLVYFYDTKIITGNALLHATDFSERIKALISMNKNMTLDVNNGDSTRAINCRIRKTSLDVEIDDGISAVEMDWQCTHVGNII